MSETSTNPERRYVTPPNTWNLVDSTAGPLGVWLEPDEEVQWHYEYVDGIKARVTGYTITKRNNP